MFKDNKYHRTGRVAPSGTIAEVKSFNHSTIDSFIKNYKLFSETLT